MNLLTKIVIRMKYSLSDNVQTSFNQFGFQSKFPAASLPKNIEINCLVSIEFIVLRCSSSFYMVIYHCIQNYTQLQSSS